MGMLSRACSVAVAFETHRAALEEVCRDQGAEAQASPAPRLLCFRFADSGPRLLNAKTYVLAAFHQQVSSGGLEHCLVATPFVCVWG